MRAHYVSNATGKAVLLKGGAQLRPGPVPGRTYCLYGDSNTTDAYYSAVSALADECIRRQPDLQKLISQVRESGTKRRRLLLPRTSRIETGPSAEILTLAREAVVPYLRDVEVHLAGLSARQRRDEVVGASPDQYALFALEAELTDRLHIEAFKAAERKVAFLPHCLRERADECKARVEGLDYVCTRCTSSCYTREVSRVLRSHEVEAYIWMQADLSKLLREGHLRPGSLGVLGVACLPELVEGMRKCDRAKVPVVGLPLDGNCCSRWWGTLRENTVDLAALERLLAG